MSKLKQLMDIIDGDAPRAHAPMADHELALPRLFMRGRDHAAEVKSNLAFGHAVSPSIGR